MAGGGARCQQHHRGNHRCYWNQPFLRGFHYLPNSISGDAPPLADPFSIAPRESAGNSSRTRGLFAHARFFITASGTSAPTAMVNSDSCAVPRASSGKSSRTRGLAAKPRFRLAAASSLFCSAQQTAVCGVAARVNHGNASRARGLAAMAALFLASRSLKGELP
jgi:hypothetical protein